ncbi:MAG: energy transducer TonB [Hahellaceae bacterium]|nr:energy transducer TonB [Hahellaceae bacterium]MCP5211473.1 energy transducer TonB [Hahellaceae bacterium]
MHNLTATSSFPADVSRWLVAAPCSLVLLFICAWVMSALIIPNRLDSTANTALVPIDFIRPLAQEDQAKATTSSKPKALPPTEQTELPAPPPLAAPQQPALAIPKPLLTAVTPVKPALTKDFLHNVTRPATDRTPRPSNTSTPAITSTTPAPPTTAPLTIAPATAVDTFHEDLFPLSTPAPAYPRMAQRRRIQGWVDVSFIINTEGRVEDLEVLAAQPEGVFEQTTLRTVSQWKYKPQMLGGKPTPRRATQTIQFNLE